MRRLKEDIAELDFIRLAKQSTRCPCWLKIATSHPFHSLHRFRDPARWTRSIIIAVLSRNDNHTAAFHKRSDLVLPFFRQAISLFADFPLAPTKECQRG